MSRAELSNLDLSHQRATLRFFTPERKKQIWKEKFNEVLKRNSFSTQELEYLNYVNKILSSNSFEKVFTEKKLMI